MKKKIRIALAVCPNGEWAVSGGSWLSDETQAHEYAVEGLPEGEKRYWIEVEVEVPTDTAEVVKGTLSEPVGESTNQ